MKVSGVLTKLVAMLAILTALACGAAATPTSPPVPTFTPIPPATSPAVATPVPRSDVKTAFEEPLSSGLSVADVVENALPSIVQIIAGSGSGTGFIVNESGLVVTNKHVVQGSTQVTLRMAGGGNFQGRVSGRHPSLDLAYIEIDSDRSFTPIAIGNSDKIRVGETVIAIGFPLGRTLGLEPTVSVGIVSAKRGDRLQTDASLNPGNSGGPLLDMFGEAIGVVTSRVDSTDSGRAVSGIAFAIPINSVKSRQGQRASAIPTTTATPPTKVMERTRQPASTPTPTLRPTPTPWGFGVPTARLGPTPVPTPIISWESLFDYTELLPRTEPKPNWQVAVERWKSLEWFEQVCSTGEVFQIAGRRWKEIPGKGHLSRIEYYEKPFPKAEFTPITHEQPGLNPNQPGLISLPDNTFETFGITCLLIDKHVDVTFACYYDKSCYENMKMEILSDQLGLILLERGGRENAVGALMKCSDGSSECAMGRIWMVSFSPPSYSNIIEYQRQNRSD